MAKLESVVAATGSAIPPVPPVSVTLFGGFETEWASLVVYQSNASYTKSGMVVAAIHYQNDLQPFPHV